MQGKRKRKSVESFQASTATPAKKKRLSISDGHGRRLGDLNLDFGNKQSDELRPLYRLLFNTPGQVCVGGCGCGWVGVGVFRPKGLVHCRVQGDLYPCTLQLTTTNVCCSETALLLVQSVAMSHCQVRCVRVLHSLNLCSLL